MRTSIESARGCGYRQPGGYYFVAPELSEPCPLLPLPLNRCPHCGQGVGPARGFTWITPPVLFPATVHGSVSHNLGCPLGLPVGAFWEKPEDMANPAFHRTGERAGLIWVGEKFYPTAVDFMDEVALMGVSRRIHRPPRGFVIGEHWIYLGHRKAIQPPEVVIDLTKEPVPTTERTLKQALDREVKAALDTFLPGVITLFKPTAIEYIVKGDETTEEIERLEERGISPVKVIRDID